MESTVYKWQKPGKSGVIFRRTFPNCGGEAKPWVNIIEEKMEFLIGLTSKNERGCSVFRVFMDRVNLRCRTKVESNRYLTMMGLEQNLKSRFGLCPIT